MMNIFELLSFDIVEFATSIEGILIIVGILFLIIGIVLLCMGKGKNKDVKVDDAVQTDKGVETAAQVMPVETTVQPVVPTAAPTVETPVDNIQPPVQNAVASAQEATPIIIPTANGGLQESATSPVVEPINFTEEVKQEPVVSTPIIENKAETLNVQPSTVNETLSSAVAPAVETLATPQSVELVVEEKATPEVLNETPVVDTPVTVYGGTNPEAVIKKETLEEKPREIYGGANPLENTAPIPTDTVREAYSGGLSSTPVTPVVTPAPAPTPAVVEMPAAPVVNPAPAPMPAVDMPASVPTPVVEPVPATVSEQQVQSSVEPKKEEIEKLEF